MTTRRALALSFLDRYAGLVLAMVSSMFIARLLTPKEIGAFSVVMVLLSFASALRDFGAGQYLLQEKELTAQRIQATWTVLLMTGLLFSVLVALGAGPLADFYADPRVNSIMLVLALNFAINPIGSLSYAWLMREMRFGALAAMRLASGIAGAFISVLLAWQGQGPISLALGSLAATAINALLALAFSPPQLSWWPSFKEVRRVIAFGGRISTTALVNNIGVGAPELLLGKLQGLAEAAFYSRAGGLAGMFQKLILDAAQSVALPLFARQARETGRLDGLLQLTIAHVTVLGWSFFGGLALMAHPLVQVLYGDQWQQAAELTRWLALGMAVGLPATLCPLALSALGAVDRMMRVSVTCAALQVVLMIFAAGFGLRAVGMAFVVAQVFSVLLWLHFTQRRTGFAWPAMLHSLCKSFLVASAALLAPISVVATLGWEPANPLTALCLALVGGLLIFMAAALGTGHPIGNEITRLLQRVLRAIE